MSAVLMICLKKQPWFESSYDHLIRAIRRRAILDLIETPAALFLHIGIDLPILPTSILIADECLSKPQYWNLWEDVVAYVKQGGTAVFMGTFATNVMPGDMEKLFSFAGLPWAMNEIEEGAFLLNGNAMDATDAAFWQLPRTHHHQALTLSGVAPSDAWYTSCSRGTAVAMADIGRGRLGYVGDVDAEEDTNAIIIAMCRLAGCSSGCDGF